MLPAIRAPRPSFSVSSKCTFLPRISHNFGRHLSTQSVKITPIETLEKVTNCKAPLNRTIIRVSGADSMKFLQNLTTQNMEQMEPHQHLEHQHEDHHQPQENTKQNSERVPLFSLMLNSQGRVLFDVLIYPDPSDPKGYLIDADANLGADTVAGHLRRFKMRSKVEIKDVTENYQVVSVFGKDIHPSTQLPSNPSSNVLVFPDPRIPQLGIRVLIPKDTDYQSLFPNCTAVTSSVYDLHRTLLGVPEGALDWQSGQSLPFELTVEYLNGVSFDKGCYLGQELTTRTHYTGVIRKYVMPLILATDDEIMHGENPTLFPPFLFTSWRKLSGKHFPPSETTLATQQGQKTGKVHSSVYHVGLGMVRLEHLQPSIEKTVLVAQGADGNTSNLRVLEPHWWKGYLQESERRKKIAEHYQG